MATKVLMPAMGMTMEEGTIVKWLVHEGEKIDSGEPLLEILTDKVDMEIEAPASGVLLKILAQPNDVVPVTSLIGIIGQAGEDISALLAEADLGQEQAPVETGELPDSEADIDIKVTETGLPLRPKASPAARRAAREQGVNLAEIAGTGPGGRIVEADVLAKPKATPVARKLASVREVSLDSVGGTGIGGKITRHDVLQAQKTRLGAAEDVLVPLSGMRKTVATRMAQSSREAAHFTLYREVDVSGLVRLRNNLAGQGIKVSYTDLLVFLVSRVLREFPALNSSWADEGIIRRARVNIGVAVALEEGLIVPVVNDADLLGLADISSQLLSLADKARSGKLAPDEYSEGTFTITNLGMFGVDSFSPVINQPESAILGVGRIVEKPVVEAGQVVVRPQVQFSLSVDHRVVDGAPGAQFLARLAQLCTEPAMALL